MCRNASLNVSVNTAWQGWVIYEMSASLCLQEALARGEFSAFKIPLRHVIFFKLLETKVNLCPLALVNVF